MKKIWLILSPVILVAVTVSIWLTVRALPRPGKVFTDSSTRMVMGTFARIVAVADNKRIAGVCVEAAFAELESVNAMMSDYDPASQLSEVNRDAWGRAVVVDKPLFEVLTLAVEYSRMSDGAFDITIGPVVDLWRDASKAQKVPSAEKIADAQKRVGYEKLILDAETQTVRFAVEGMRLDPGGIAKGYAIDLAAKAMRDNGAAGGMVDVGGDIYCFGITPKSEDHWRIGLQDPTKEGDILLVLKLADAGVATSGDYRRSVSVEGQKHSHIMDPGAGDSARGLSSVSIIAGSAVKADALATMVTVMGKDRGLAVIESLSDTEAILALTDAEDDLILSSGARSYIDFDRMASWQSGPSPIFTESIETKRDINMDKKYSVLKAAGPIVPDGNWDGPAWGKVATVEIDNFMGDEPEHKPKTQAKVLYDDSNLHVMFRVEDRFVRAVAQKYQGMVYQDSCVEFFFTPGTDIEQGYFNLETNCGGTMLFCHQLKRGENVRQISNADHDRIEIFHSEPKIVEPEKQQPTTWVVQYRLPFDILAKYAPAVKPAPGVIWKANFYKCADKTSHPHWLTWSVVENKEPDFHRPEFFGTLEFR